MDIVKITMNGYGCEINRGIIIEENYKKIEKYLDNVWVKNLFKELEKETEIKILEKEYGLIKGDIKIEVNDVTLIETTIKSLEAFVNNEKEIIEYPNTKDIIITSIQHQEGVFSDTIFILNDDFDLNKIVLLKKDISNRVDNLLVSSLYCGLYYDGELIPMTDNITDLRMSRLYFEKQNEKNKNKEF
tara:strand:- start:13583 stop:14143 length:561 start_codon:yes stop_codon:yes gene_type:complete